MCILGLFTSRYGKNSVRYAVLMNSRYRVGKKHSGYLRIEKMAGVYSEHPKSGLR
ncbi:MAG: hypothetical protein HOP34_14860 [Methylococcaceae bacterium]|nr:hypothetical protein [Methylococcaceae bacterium]